MIELIEPCALCSTAFPASELPDVEQGFDQAREPPAGAQADGQHRLQRLVLGRDRRLQHFQAGDDVAQRGAQVVEDHRRQVRPQFVQRLTFGDIAQDPLEQRLTADLHPGHVHLNGYRMAVGMRHPGVVGDGDSGPDLPQVLRQALCIGDVQREHRPPAQRLTLVPQEGPGPAIGVRHRAGEVADQDRVDVVLEQRGIALARFLRGFEQLGVLQGDARLVPDHPQQRHVLRGEMVPAGMSQREHPGHTVTRHQRDAGGGIGLAFAVAVVSPQPARIETGVRHDRRLAVLHHPACQTTLERVGQLLGGVRVDLASVGQRAFADAALLVQHQQAAAGRPHGLQRQLQDAFDQRVQVELCRQLTADGRQAFE